MLEPLQSSRIEPILNLSRVRVVEKTLAAAAIKNDLTAPVLRHLESFAPLSGDERLALDRLAQHHCKSAGPRDDIVHEGDKPTAVIMILNGWACRYKQLRDGRRQILSLFVPGDFGHANIFLLGSMDHSIGAITDVDYAQVPAGEFERMAAGSPGLSTAFGRHELTSAAITREWMMNVGQRCAIERIAHLLCELFFRLRAVGLVDGQACPLPLTQNDLAEATGLTPIHVNRVVQQLRRRKLITLHDKVLTVLDLDALMETGLFNPDYLHLTRDQDRGARVPA